MVAELPVIHRYVSAVIYVSGLQQGVISSAQPYGLPLNETVFPQYLKQFGYATHVVGKVCKSLLCFHNFELHYISSILYDILNSVVIGSDLKWFLWRQNGCLTSKILSLTISSSVFGMQPDLELMS